MRRGFGVEAMKGALETVPVSPDIGVLLGRGSPQFSITQAQCCFSHPYKGNIAIFLSNFNFTDEVYRDNKGKLTAAVSWTATTWLCSPSQINAENCGYWGLPLKSCHSSLWNATWVSLSYQRQRKEDSEIRSSYSVSLNCGRRPLPMPELSYSEPATRWQACTTGPWTGLATTSFRLEGPGGQCRTKPESLLAKNHEAFCS